MIYRTLCYSECHVLLLSAIFWLLGLNGRMWSWNGALGNGRKNFIWAPLLNASHLKTELYTESDYL